MINPKDLGNKEELPQEFVDEFQNGKGDDEEDGGNAKVHK